MANQLNESQILSFSEMNVLAEKFSQIGHIISSDNAMFEFDTEMMNPISSNNYFFNVRNGMLYQFDMIANNAEGGEFVFLMAKSLEDIMAVPTKEDIDKIVTLEVFYHKFVKFNSDFILPEVLDSNDLLRVMNVCKNKNPITQEPYTIHWHSIETGMNLSFLNQQKIFVITASLPLNIYFDNENLGKILPTISPEVTKKLEELYPLHRKNNHP